jgi:hypothetical protein
MHGFPMNTTIKIARSRLLVGTLLLLLVALAGCGGDGETEKRAPGGSAADAASAVHGGGDPATSSSGTILAGVTFTPPANWRDLGPDGMRKAQYRLDPVEGDAAPAEVNVFYFGPQSGGGVEANLQRWIGQMVVPDGGDPAAVAERSTFTADGMAGHVVALDGSYKSGGGRPMGGGGAALPGYRLVGVVLEGPQGSLFFKLTGPAATARAMEGDLVTMVQDARK